MIRFAEPSGESPGVPQRVLEVLLCSAGGIPASAPPPRSCIEHVAYPIDAMLRPGGEITQSFRI